MSSRGTTGVRRTTQLTAATVSALITLGASMVVALAVPELLASPENAEPILIATVILQPIWLVSVACVALLLNVRQPSNRIGWLFAVLGPLLGFIVGVWSYRWPIPSGWELEYAWLSTTASFYVVALAGPGLALWFPDGRLPSRRWTVPVALVASAFAFSVLLVGLAPGYLVEMMPPDARPPDETTAGFGVEGLTPFADLLSAVAFGGLLTLLAMGVLALVVRGRRGGSVLRAQLRWFLVAASLILTGIAASLIESVVQPDAETTVGVVLMFSGFVLTPIAVAIAILRYRLYDIDVIIRRTLVYGAVVAILACVYVALVLALQIALSGVTGGGTLPVAISTLAIAALFGPVRARVREAVDQRFYRSRYDARRTLERFATGLRDEVELEAVASGLVSVASDAVRPASAALWIRNRPA